MNRAAYNALPGINWSTLKHAGKSPKHYRHAVDAGDKEPTPAMRIGSAVHCAVLEPDEFPRRYVVWTGGARRGKAWTTFRDSVEDGREILTESECDRCIAIRDAVRNDPVAAKYLAGPGTFERVIQWTDEETGLRCKGIIDRCADDVDGKRVLVDLKTTADANPHKFAATAARLGYHGQFAYYFDGMDASGEPVDRVVMIVVETSGPFDVCVYNVGEEVLWAGEEMYRGLLEKVKGCMSLGRWPGRFLCEEEFTLPQWAYPDDGEDVADALGLTGLEDGR